MSSTDLLSFDPGAGEADRSMRGDLAIDSDEKKVDRGSRQSPERMIETFHFL
jgi:hypothetical protein